MHTSTNSLLPALLLLLLLFSSCICGAPQRQDEKQQPGGSFSSYADASTLLPLPAHLVSHLLASWRPALNLADPPPPKCPIQPSPVPLPAGSTPPELTQAFKDLQQSITTLFNAETIASCLSAAVVYRDQIIYHFALGTTNTSTNTPPDLDTIFRLASVSKVFPTIMLYQLYEKGIIHSLDDPISKYVPQFNIKNPFTRHSITWKQIASQLSGTWTWQAESHQFDQSFKTINPRIRSAQRGAVPV